MTLDSQLGRDPRWLAAQAAARGWMDAGSIWDAALRFAQLGSAASATDVLTPALSPEQLTALLLPLDGTLAQPEFHLRTPLDPAAPNPQLSTLDSRLPRYTPGPELGRGGMGTVIAALDRETGRTVALKTLHPDAAMNESATRRFLHEAQITAQLEHPSVVPVYDMGALPGGKPFYTMRIVKRRSLREVLVLPPPRREWPLARLCTVFVQVCRAIGYAHARKVLHRDLKPENILLGDHGEVYVADWGIAKVLDRTEIEPASSLPADLRMGRTGEGVMMGTPGYMSPEQVRGEQSELDARSDVFSLGAILYEMLTGTHAIEGTTPLGLINATLEQTPRSPREIVPGCPLVLEELCLRMLAKRSVDRPASADEVADEVEAYLEGAKEKARRQEEAVRLAQIAKGHAERYEALVREADRLATEAKAALRAVKPWDEVARKRPGWALEDGSRRAETEQAKALAATVELYSQALGYDAESTVVRAGLADLYWSRFGRAESTRDLAAQRYNESLVRQYDDGRYARMLSADARVSIHSPRAPAEVVAYRYVPVDRVLRAVEPRLLGRTPVREARLEPGSWLLVLESPGFRDVRYPLACGRGEHHEAEVNLYTDAEIGDAMIYVPAGRCIVGGDPDAFEALARQEVMVDDFAIGRFPATFGEYLAFINELERTDPVLAQKRLPRSAETGEGLVAVRDERGLWIPRYEVILEGEGKKFCPEERAVEIAAMSMDWFDALAYVRWQSARDGVTYRLPTEIEWEKSARGVDERVFPWGDAFDPSFCKMRDSRPGFGQPEPVGGFPTDESVYGVRDLAGSMRSWIADIHRELSVEDALRESEPTAGAPRDFAGMRVSRGGAWGSVASWSRSASRYRHFAMNRLTGVGVRMVKKLRVES